MMRLADMPHYLCALLLLSILLSPTICLPINETLDEAFEIVSAIPHGMFRRQAKVTLRVMPLGASITAGHGTNPMHGYRKKLRTLLRFSGHPVNMVGSQ